MEAVRRVAFHEMQWLPGVQSVKFDSKALSSSARQLISYGTLQTRILQVASCEALIEDSPQRRAVCASRRVENSSRVE